MGACLSKSCSRCTGDKDETTPKDIKVDDGDTDCKQTAKPESIDVEFHNGNMAIPTDTGMTSGYCAISGETDEIPVQDLEMEPHVQLTEHDMERSKLSEFKTEGHGPKPIKPRTTDDNEPYGTSSSFGNKGANSDIASIPSHVNDSKPIVYYTEQKKKENIKPKNENGKKEKNCSKTRKNQNDGNLSDTDLKAVDRSKENCNVKTKNKKKKKHQNNSFNGFRSGFTEKSRARQRRVQGDTDSSDSLESSDTESSSSSDSESEEEVKHPKKRNKKHSSPGKHYSAVNMQFGKHNKIINQNIKHYSEGRKKSSKRKQKHNTTGTFKTEKPRTDGQGPDFSLNKANAVAIKNREIIVNAAKSVGIIRGPGTVGTGFRVGGNFVMTALHVVEKFLDGNGYLQDPYLHQLSIQFDYKDSHILNIHMLNIQNKTFVFESKVAYQNKDLDTAVLQIKADPNKTMPDALKIFGEVSNDLCLIGHPGGNVLQDDTQLYVWPRNQEVMKKARIWSIKKFGRDGYQGIERESRVLFHTSFAHGASGAPGMHIDEVSGTSVVTAMLLRGYPDFCFTDELSQEKLNEITNAHRIEEGITMKHISKAMKENGHSDLSFQIFGHCFDGRN